MNRCEQDDFKLGTFSYLVKIQLFVAFVSLFKYSLLKNWSFRLYNKSTLEISNICTLFTKPYYLLKSCFATKYVVQYSREKLLGNPLANGRIFSKKEIKFQITICLNIIYLCIYEISSTIHHFNFQVSFQHGLEH